jgi:integrase
VGREKQREKQSAARAWSFRRLADDHLEKAASRFAEATIAGRRQQLRDYVLPRIGNIPARDVTPAEVVEIVERATVKSLHVANLVLIALREVFAHGIAKHVIESNPCAHIRAKSVIGPRPINRTRIMLTEAELRAMLPALPTIGRQNELMVKVLLAAATRIGELVNARWEHIDFNRREWIIPPEHSKNGKEFVVPLTDQVLGWLSELHTLAFGSPFVLPLRVKRGDRSGDAPMESTSLNAAINRLCAKLGKKCRRFTPHDLRSTARSQLGALGVEVLIAERCLNHSLGSRTHLWQ